MFSLRDLPTFEMMAEFARRYPDLDPKSLDVYLHLLRVSSDMLADLDCLLQRHGLLQGRMYTLALLMRREDRTSTATELAAQVGVTKATMTTFIDGLERDGLVERVDDPADRRKISIRLTAAGQKKLDAVMPDYYRNITRVVGHLSEARRGQLASALRAIASALAPASDEQPAALDE